MWEERERGRPAFVGDEKVCLREERQARSLLMKSWK